MFKNVKKVCKAHIAIISNLFFQPYPFKGCMVFDTFMAAGSEAEVYGRKCKCGTSPDDRGMPIEVCIDLQSNALKLMKHTKENKQIV